MKTSLIQRSAFPPASEMIVTRAEVSVRARIRGAMIVSALLFDVALILLLRGSPGIRPQALLTFGEINVGLLLVDLALVNVFLRDRGPRFQGAQMICAAIEVVTVLTWIQLTGLVSSYFLIAGPLLIVLYRAQMGYWVALWAAALLTTGHVGAFVAEELHLLQSTSLFTDAGAIYSSAPLFRWGALVSIITIYAFVFFAANVTATAFREKEAALSAARKDVERAVEDGRPGRLVGEALGGYRLRELLGRGGMGEVYRAERQSDGREAAVKVLHRHLGWERQVVLRFQREVALVKRMEARLVAEILDAGETSDGVHYLAMELLRGEDMGALLRRRERLTLADLLEIIDPLADALDSAHALGIIHRDVKPQNVFLAHGGAGAAGPVAVKLLDFGIARLLETADEENLTSTLAVVGTPGYLAPEQITASLGPIGAETDIFALGAVAYRALTGRPAFGATRFAEVLDAALHGQPLAPSDLVSELTADVDAVIALAIAKRPQDRYPRARAFAADLRAAYEGRLEDAVRTRARELSVFSALPSGPTLAMTHS